MGEASVIWVDEYVILVDKRVKDEKFRFKADDCERNGVWFNNNWISTFDRKSDKKRLWLYENRFNFIYT